MNALARMFPGARGIAPLFPDLKTVCCECGVTIREGVAPVSHGYCQPCADNWRRVNLPPKREAK